MNVQFRNHADLPHFSYGPREPRFLKPGLKSTQKSRLALPTNPGLTIYKGSIYFSPLFLQNMKGVVRIVPMTMQAIETKMTRAILSPGCFL
jgi:hypothetical protein